MAIKLIFIHGHNTYYAVPIIGFAAIFRNHFIFGPKVSFTEICMSNGNMHCFFLVADIKILNFQKQKKNTFFKSWCTIIWFQSFKMIGPEVQPQYNNLARNSKVSENLIKMWHVNCIADFHRFRLEVFFCGCTRSGLTMPLSKN